MVTTPTYSDLRGEITEALRSHYRRWIGEHPEDDVYAYVIYATGLVSAIGVSVLTEQGLQKVAAQYRGKAKCPQSIEWFERDLRWSVADTPYCGDFQECFDHVNDRLQSMMPYVDSLDVEDSAFSEHIDRLYAALIDSLSQFRRTELNGAIRPMLYVDFGDMSDEERLWFIQQCNTPGLVEEYRLS